MTASRRAVLAVAARRGVFFVAAVLAARLLDGHAFAQGLGAAEGRPLPMATKRVAASAEECTVWRRELAFAGSVEGHDARAFASFLHSGTLFNAGAAEADRGRAAVTASWAEIVEGKTLVLRWRPGIAQIAGEKNIAISRGPYIVQTVQGGEPAFRVGLFQTVWVRDAAGGDWLVLYDGSASTPQKMADRAAADRWVQEQAMSDCAP